MLLILTILRQVELFQCSEFSNESLILALQHGYSVFQTTDVLFFFPPALTSSFPKWVIQKHYSYNNRIVVVVAAVAVIIESVDSISRDEPDSP